MYSAYNYLQDRTMHRNLRDIIMRTEDPDQFLRHLMQTPYARCVYDCDNDVVDHQTVQMEYEDGITASWQASAFTVDIRRQTKVMGTKGEMEGSLEDNCFHIRDFASGNVKTIHVHTPKTLHSGGDECIMQTFTDALRHPEIKHENLNAELSLQGHIMAFAAEESRRQNGKVINLD